MAKKVPCRSDYIFQQDLEVPVAATGELGAPALGAVTGIRLRLSQYRDRHDPLEAGYSLNTAVTDLIASERSGHPGRFYVLVDAALLAEHVLPLGVGKRFYAIWSKAGDMDLEAVGFTVAEGNTQ